MIVIVMVTLVVTYITLQHWANSCPSHIASDKCNMLSLDFWGVEPHVRFPPILKTPPGQTRLSANDLGSQTTVCPGP